MAVAMLATDEKIPIHRPCHDLESAYWVLLWIVLRHTKHDLGQQICETVFIYGNDWAAQSSKNNWLSGKKKLRIARNRPLTRLLRQYRSLIWQHLETNTLEHGHVIALFDEALTLGDWPTDDDLVECTLLDTPKTQSLMQPILPAKLQKASAPLPSLLNSFQKSKASKQKARRDRGLLSAPGAISLPPPQETSTGKRRRNGEVDTGAIDEQQPIAGPSNLSSRATRVKKRRTVSAVDIDTPSKPHRSTGG